MPPKSIAGGTRGTKGSAAVPSSDDDGDMKKPGQKKGGDKPRGYKTYDELVAIEAERKKEEELMIAEERVKRERWERRWAWTKFLNPVTSFKYLFPPDWNKKAMLKLGDKLGRAQAHFKTLHAKSKMDKRMWFLLWCDMDRGMNNSVTYTTFIKYFSFNDDIWSRRLYDIANENLNGALSFAEFLGFCAKYLYIDRETTIEFSFRMISRRGSTFNPKISVLDLEDIRQFVRFRFKMNDPKEMRRRALDLVDYIDTDGNGSLYLDEFELFTNERNSIFVRFTHLWQMHLRKCIYGLRYWVDISRQIKRDRAKGVDAVALFHRMNLDSETFARVQLESPIVDDRGRVVVVPPWVPVKVSTPATSAFTATGLGGSVAPLPPISPAASAATPSTPLPPAPGAAVAAPKRSLLVCLRRTPVPVPTVKKMLAWRGPSSAAVNMAISREYEEEFPELHLVALERKAKKKAEKAKSNDLAKAVAAHTYKRLVSVCEDLIYGRKWLRLAFNQWVDVVGMEKQETAAGKKAAEDKRLVARKRMAKLITKANIKDLSLRDVGDEDLSKLAAQEAAEKEAAMFGPRSGLEQIASKLEDGGVLVDDMHSRIVENCRKQEAVNDDPDDQCALYVREFFMRSHIEHIQTYRHERLHRFVKEKYELEPSPEVRSMLRQDRLPAFLDWKLRLDYKEAASDSESDEESV
jgi:hypothetical protein